MKMSYSMRIINPKSFVQAMEKAALRANAAAAEDYVQEVCANIQSGKAPDGSGQKSNKPSTSRQKRRTLGHARPLVGKTETLSNPSRWRIRVARGVVIVTPPEERITELRYISRLGYKTTGIPSSFAVKHRARLAHEFSRTLPGIRFERIQGGSK